ncbi:MAG: hypothetical protein JWR50_1018 [Mucilaginibacter sp.]|nr:hypothetical protein [Mucilaginibacter sp.]
MRAENPAALRFILQDDVYLLPNDKTVIKSAGNPPVAEAESGPVSTPKIEPVTPPKNEPIVETPAIQFNYLGSNKKRFLITTHYTDQEFIAADHLTALQNILKRKAHDIDDVAILNVSKNNANNFDELLNYFKPTKLLLLGKEAVPAKMEALTLNQPKQLAGCMALYSFSFDEMMDNTEYKKAFWEQMKTL